jgi:hypothetical protein
LGFGYKPVIETSQVILFEFNKQNNIIMVTAIEFKVADKHSVGVVVPTHQALSLAEEIQATNPPYEVCVRVHPGDFQPEDTTAFEVMRALWMRIS